jgi:tetratricopeptide (TPR) repeat protein
MWDLAVREEDYPGIDAMLARYRGRPPLSLRLLPAAARSDSVTLRALLEEGRTLESRQLQIAARYAASYLEDFGLADSLAKLDLQWRERPANRAGAQLLLAGLAAAGGRWSAARSAYRTAETMEGAGPVIIHEAFTATMPLQPVGPDDLRALRDAVGQWDPSASPVRPGLAGALQPHLRQYLLGLLSSRMGDWAAAEGAAAAIESLSAPSEGQAVAAGLATTVRADVAWMQKRPADALRALEGVEPRVPLELISLSRAAHLREYGLEHARYLRAVSLSAVGRHSDALTWFRFGLRGSPQEYLYLAPVHLQLGELFGRMGQRDSSAAHYRRFLSVWSGADSASAPLRDDVRRRLTELGDAR